MKKIYEIESKKELAKFFQMPLKKLTYILYVKNPDNYYKSFEIPKKNGEIRQINAPTGDLKALQVKIANSLWDHQKNTYENGETNNSLSHGFEKNKSIITNAEIHRNKRYVLNIDFENYFDSFHFGRVRGYFGKNRNFNLSKEIATILAQITCYKGKLPQGAPSSPIITNLISNIFDNRVSRIAKKYKTKYTRYADDLTFSTNDKEFLARKDKFCDEIKKEAELFGFKINDKKTRLMYSDSRQEVTGLIVNKKVNVNRKYYKFTRAMADNLYTNGTFYIDGIEGTIKQLEGRFAFINQLDFYNNKLNSDKKNNKSNYKKCKNGCLNSREKQYQIFLFYKYFYANAKPLIVTEGKTDVIYLKAALKKYYLNYPEIIEKKGDQYEYKISYLNKTRRIKYFLGLSEYGADTMNNIFNAYVGKNGFRNCFDYIDNKSKIDPKKPVILVFDNEQKSDKPLKKFIGNIAQNKIEFRKDKLSTKIKSNLYTITNPLVKDMEESEIEDLFGDEVLNHKIEGKTFSREKKFDDNKYYGKVELANYVYNNYSEINFSKFVPMLDELNSIIVKHNEDILCVESRIATT